MKELSITTVEPGELSTKDKRHDENDSRKRKKKTQQYATQSLHRHRNSAAGFTSCAPDAHLGRLVLAFEIENSEDKKMEN